MPLFFQRGYSRECANLIKNIIKGFIDWPINLLRRGLPCGKKADKELPARPEKELKNQL